MIDTKELRPIVGGNVKRLREAKGMTQLQLSEKVKVQRDYISRVENGQYMPSGEVLFALADAFGVPTDVLRKKPVHAA